MSRPPQHISKDGRWWWDGERWLPMPEQPPAPPKARYGAKLVLIAIIAAATLFILWRIATGDY